MLDEVFVGLFYKRQAAGFYEYQYHPFAVQALREPRLGLLKGLGNIIGAWRVGSHGHECRSRRLGSTLRQIGASHHTKRVRRMDPCMACRADTAVQPMKLVLHANADATLRRRGS